MKRFVVKNGNTINISNFIRKGVLNGNITYIEARATEGTKLDYYAQKHYSDASLWWVIAAASGIGWWLQVTPGTVLYIPMPIDQISKLAERI